MSTTVTDLVPAYSEVMEDHAAIEAALEPRPGERALCIASGGDNAFHLALHGVSVVAIDVAPEQIDLCRLKEAAIRVLDAVGWQELAGARDAAAGWRAGALATVSEAAGVRVGPHLAAGIARDGLVGCGRLSAFVGPLRDGLAQIVGAARISALLTEPDPRVRRAIWHAEFENETVTGFFDAALGEHTIADAFIPARAWPRMAEPRFGLHYVRVLSRLVLQGEPRENSYLHRLWLGRFEGALPPYLTADGHARLRASAGSIEWDVADVAERLSASPPASFDLVNLSNVLDWCDDDAHDRLWAALARGCAPGARLFLRSFLAHRAQPPAVARDWRLDVARSEAAARADRVGYFSRYECWRRA